MDAWKVGNKLSLYKVCSGKWSTSVMRGYRKDKLCGESATVSAVACFQQELRGIVLFVNEYEKLNTCNE